MVLRDVLQRDFSAESVSQPGLQCFNLQEHGASGLAGLHWSGGNVILEAFSMDWSVDSSLLSSLYPSQGAIHNPSAL